MNISPFLQMKSLQTELRSRLAAIDTYALPAKEQKLLQSLENELIDVRLDIQDYELSETRAAQLTKAHEARKRLERIRKGILAASEYNVFSGAEVAQLSARLEQIMEDIR